jgi:hypothetical protein
MPTYEKGRLYIGHWWFCNRAWNIPCNLRGRWTTGKCQRSCPIDGIPGWHDRHEKNPTILGEQYKLITRNNDPKSEGCTAWVQGVLKAMRLDEDAFHDFADKVLELSSKALLNAETRPEEAHLRLCWTAHLWADFACAYWHVAIGKPSKSLGDNTTLLYKAMSTEDRKKMGDFVKRNVIPILASQCGHRV